MSDFFTKKQRKYWCENCKVFIEYTKIIIEQHNKSKNHLRMINADKSYQIQKNKIMRHIAYNFDVEQAPNYQREYNGNYIGNKTDRYNTQTNQEFGYNDGFESNNFGRSGYTTESSLLLEEIKKEKMKEMIRERSVLKQKPKEWGMFWDNTHNLPYYYNFITNISQWEKPDNLDASEVREEQVETIATEPIKSKEVSIGKWEVVKKEDSFFEKNKLKAKINPKIPGEISKREFYMTEYGIECSESDDEEIDQKNETKYQSINKKNTIDKYIHGSDESKPDDNEPRNITNSKDELIELNNHLKRNDFDLKDVNQLYYDQSSSCKNLKLLENRETEKEDADSSNKNDLCITLSKVNKKEKKISSIFDKNVEDD